VDKEYVLKFIEDVGIIKNGKFYPSYYNKKLLPVLDFFNNMEEGNTLSEKIYLLYYNISIPKCANPKCNNKVKFIKFSKGYNKTCCPSCGQKNPKTRNKIEKTNLKKYGVITTTQSEVIKEKSKNTNLKKYGTNYACQSSEVKEKIKQTNIERYGVENPNQCKEIREKIEKTNLKKYGRKVAVPFGSKEYRAIIKEKYGNECYQQTDDYKNKMKGKLNYKEIHEKVKATMKERYGVERALQDPEFYRKAKVNVGKAMGGLTKISQNLHYQTKPELECIQFHQDNSINIWDGPSIPYMFEEKEHIYHIDFETDKYLIEIKSSHGWYYENLASGKIDAKNKAAQKYAASIGKEFKFLLDIKDYSSIFGYFK
jgi:hypothetical protein